MYNGSKMSLYLGNTSLFLSPTPKEEFFLLYSQEEEET